MYVKHIVLFFWFSLFIGQEKPVAHTIHVHHPAFEDNSTQELQLYHTHTALESEFYLDVESVICIEHVCKIVPVRLFWDAFGRYKRYELGPKVALEKGIGKPFSEQDYMQLQSILADSSSPYKDISYYDITHEKVLGKGQVDAISGATEIILNKEKTIIGAAWTCFTLWHWAHGEVTDNIRAISLGHLDQKQWQQLLQQQDSFILNHSLQALKQQHQFSKPLWKTILKQYQKKNLALTPILDYLQAAPDTFYFDSLLALHKVASNKDQSILMHAALARPTVITESFAKNLCTAIEGLDYNLLDSALKIIALQPTIALDIDCQNNIAKLLEHPSFIKARRAYYHLNQQKLHPELQKLTTKFYTRNKHRL